VQRYAIHTAHRGVTFVCRKKSGGSDLNTQAISSVRKISAREYNSLDKSGAFLIGSERESVVKDVISHVYGTSVARELLTMECCEGNIEQINNLILESYRKSKKVEAVNESGLAFKAFGFISNASYRVPKASTAFILFINDRLVECASLKRVLESIYAEASSQGSKPFIYLSLDLPGPHLDVNIHPTKREVAIFHEDLLCQAIYEAARKVLYSATSSRTFYAQTILPKERQKDDQEKKLSVSEEDAICFTTKDCMQELPKSQEKMTQLKLHSNASAGGKKRPSLSQTTLSQNKTVRTILTPAMSLEPFLSHIEKKESKSQTISFQCNCGPVSITKSIDLSIPGSFSQLCKCQVNQPGKTLETKAINNIEIAKPRPPPQPKKIVPSDCTYASIISLRNDVLQNSHRDLVTKLRDSIFVGCVSRHRSLIQHDTELLMIDHSRLLKELFYQVALSRFGDAAVAKLGKSVDVKHVIAHILSCSKEEGEDRDTSTESILAEQATECLQQHAQMLEEYFSITFQISDDHLNDGTRFLLTGLPVLIEGYEPCAYALSLFLLRLATEVDYNDEKSCFKGICSELGAFYAELPVVVEDELKANRNNKKLIDIEAEKTIRHCIHPALSFLLVPHKDLANDGSFVRLAHLPSLYRLFERC